jgi:cytochrome c551/c552
MRVFSVAAAVMLGAVAVHANLQSVAAADPDPAATLAERRGCRQCHDLDRLRIGPAFSSVADRYRGDPDAQSRLVDWLETGGRGHWGEAYAMSEQSRLRPGDAEMLVRWVLRQ